MPHSEDRLEWTNEIPTLAELYERGGEPGKEYAYVSAERVPEAQREGGYRQVRESPVFRLHGPGGSVPFLVMERGESIAGLRPESARPTCKVDVALESALQPGAPAQAPAAPEAPPSASPEPESPDFVLPCGVRKPDKRSATGHLRFCKKPECAGAREAGARKADDL